MWCGVCASVGSSFSLGHHFFLLVFFSSLKWVMHYGYKLRLAKASFQQLWKSHENFWASCEQDMSKNLVMNKSLASHEQVNVTNKSWSKLWWSHEKVMKTHEQGMNMNKSSHEKAMDKIWTSQKQVMDKWWSSYESVETTMSWASHEQAM